MQSQHPAITPTHPPAHLGQPASKPGPRSGASPLCCFGSPAPLAAFAARADPSTRRPLPLGPPHPPGHSRPDPRPAPCSRTSFHPTHLYLAGPLPPPEHPTHLPARRFSLPRGKRSPPPAPALATITLPEPPGHIRAPPHRPVFLPYPGVNRQALRHLLTSATALAAPPPGRPPPTCTCWPATTLLTISTNHRPSPRRIVPVHPTPCSRTSLHPTHHP